MATWNAAAALTALVDLVKTVPGQLSVEVGAPEAMSSTVMAYVTIGSSEIIQRTTESYRAVIDYVVTFGYAVSGHEETAEATLAAALSEFDRRVLQNRQATVTGNSVSVTPLLNGTVTSIDPPLPAVGVSDYATFAGQENRLHPRAVRVYQDEVF